MQVYRCRKKSTEEALLKLHKWSRSYGFPMVLLVDSGPSFCSKFEDEALKMGVRVEHSSAYNPSSMNQVERSIQSLKHLLKRSSHMTQLQISECIFAIHSRIQPGGCGSAIARFFQRDVRSGLPNSLDRSMDWKILMENHRKAHLRRVDRKGKTTKDSFEVGEFCRVQNIATKLWDSQGEITVVRTACDGRIVSYDLLINNRHSTEHG